jgi:Electron transfer DM13
VTTRTPQATGDHPGAPFRWMLSVLAVMVVLGLGLWFFGGVVAPGYTSSLVLSGVWFAAVGVGIGWFVARRPAWRLPLRATFAAAAVLGLAGFYWTSVRDDTVNEAVVTGVAPSPVAPAPGSDAATPAAPTNTLVATGAFAPRAHAGSGTASVVALATGGQRLTLTDFATDNGPDLRVYLVKGPVTGDGDVTDTVDLGRLKGNVGNQQYDIPEGTDVTRYSTVVIWCRAFTVSFAQADLRAT